MKPSCIPLNPQAPHVRPPITSSCIGGGVREPIPGSLLFGPFPYSSGGAFSGKSGGDVWKPIPGGRLFGHLPYSLGIPLKPQAYL